VEEHLIEALDEAQPHLREFVGDTHPACLIILGSGLNPFADGLSDARTLAFGEVPHMWVSTAEGHRGRFVLGRTVLDDGAKGPWVLCMQGRAHGYEGAEPWRVALPVWLAWRLGIDTLITTNAAGAVNPSYRVGDFCVMADQLNLTGRNPLCGVQPDRIAPRFVPMKDAFDPALRSLARDVARREGVRVQEGVYAGLLGPSFETPAEVRALATLGADTVAMSVCEEVIAARHVGMRVLGISLCSNMACGVAGADPNGDEVMDVASTREGDFSRLMTGVVNGLDTLA
jgi:purine-nucleoside phosphorylase